MVFLLTEDHVFPDPKLAEEDGLLAVGGDLSAERILLAYRQGIFPWFSGEEPILWWSPDPRLILFPEKLRISKSLQQTLRSGKFRISFDACFDQVIAQCAHTERKEQSGTWISKGMKNAYQHLHELGHAHSVEAWYGTVLVGGLYGLSIGKVFFGESMFHKLRDASKVCLVALVEKLLRDSFTLIDCQVTTMHLVSMGAQEISREQYLSLLKEGIQKY